MIVYLIKSAIGLWVLLAVYRLVLEREKMYVFNRFYLLFSLVLAFCIPFLELDLGLNWDIRQLLGLSVLSQKMTGSGNMELMDWETMVSWQTVLFFLYLSVVTIFAFRFVRNILAFKTKVRHNERVAFNNTQIVLLDEAILPYSFLRYIFVNKDAFHQNKIEKEVYTHELGHVCQYHSLDILLIQLLQIVFWFNPLIYSYKKAIKLNHEFLADEFVLRTFNNVSAYQSILLEKVKSYRSPILASQLKGSFTKKRFQMMTKVSSRTRIFRNKFAMLPLFVLFVLLFGTRATAQENIAAQPLEKMEMQPSHTQLYQEDRVDWEMQKIPGFVDSLRRREANHSGTFYEFLSWKADPKHPSEPLLKKVKERQNTTRTKYFEP